MFLYVCLKILVFLVLLYPSMFLTLCTYKGIYCVELASVVKINVFLIAAWLESQRGIWSVRESDVGYQSSCHSPHQQPGPPVHPQGLAHCAHVLHTDKWRNPTNLSVWSQRLSWDLLSKMSIMIDDKWLIDYDSLIDSCELVVFYYCELCHTNLKI